MLPDTSRRDFLKTTGCLTIGFVLLGAGELLADAPQKGELPGSLQDNPRINAWLEILPNGRARVLTGKIEIGQGIRTAVAQVAAEELNLPVEAVEVTIAETGRTPDERYTAGSASIEQSAMAIRHAAAAARQKLLALAAPVLGQKVSQLRLEPGAVVAPNGRRVSVDQLLGGRQLTDEVRQPAPLKPKSQYQHVGRSVPRQDIEHMVRAEPYYVQDLRFPGMVHARVLRPHSYEATLLQFDTKALQQAIPGVLKTVIDGSFVGILAEQEYQALRAQDYGRLHAQWSAGRALPVDKPLPELLRSLPGTVKDVARKGDFLKAPAAGVLTHQASYFKPYLMHGSIGPSCAVALFEPGTQALHVWTHSQGVYPLRESLAKLLNLHSDNVHVKGVPGSGCYGHNGADDVAADAALLARAVPGRHVRLQWSRDDEHAWEPYGSAMLFDLQARVEAKTGRITHWQHELWSDTHSTRPAGSPEKLLAAQYMAQPQLPKTEDDFSGGIHRNAEPYYQFPALQVRAHAVQGPLRVSALRGLGAFGNIFALESFMEELAVQARQDPYEFRLRHLTDERAKAVIRRVREMVKGEKPAANEGLGLAFARYKNTAAYCAVVAKVSVDPGTGFVRVPRIWAAIDAGEVINPDGLKNQTEGGLTQAASWTLNEEVLFNAQGITTRQWEQYPIFRFDEAPLVEVAVLDRPTEPPLGAGEAAQGPTAAALANAVFHACGKRVRHLPIRPEKLLG
ncbi:xanthine dehydrogenase family protein molybdopterin-binding subunit [Microvirga sp. STR05]|uniref:Xanthine dehydrogenase family protein molybdopterin-binding subunit n=1 Tax=Hymenobacter duratus TaxID=2771356 RepID=A0ABR8JK99_9BACT|nr:molybdopterin cofactor-binding domain-containing protein [Hymenobacter duratus]MBD2716128.1 xanthine dehydrogenase family protein molybdopterin-binding subunit [Hymenobacter duratus]MBR7951042.1 xanthine dehydrogenase family protein molybdopterin-binding subunit [Microvirga sp. STR05]